MKRSQIVNQVFVYVLAAIVFTMVLIYGYRAIGDFMEKANYVSLVELKTELESSVNEVALTFNSEDKTFSIPSDYDAICFIDYSMEYDDSYCESNVNHIVCDAWKSNTTDNVFLIPLGELPMRTVRVELKDESGDRQGAVCYDITKRNLKLRLTGKGDRTRIERVI